MNKRLLILTVAFAIIAAGVGSTISYFNSKDSADNIFTVGNVSIELSEPSWNSEEDHIVGKDAEFAKDPTVTNTGDNDAYVRVKVKIENCSEVTEALGLEKAQDLDSLFSGSLSPEWTPAGTNYNEEANEITYIYRHDAVLKPEESTAPVFSVVHFPNTTDSEKVINLPGDGIVIKVSADAIQTESFENAEDAFAAMDALN